MKVPRSQLAEIIGERTLEVRNLALLTREIAAYLLSEKRSHELESLMRDVLAYRQARGIVEADVATAHDLSETALKEVAALLKAHYPRAKKVIVKSHLDPEVIGGLKVGLAHEQLDMSVRAKLDTFKRLTTEGMK
jgi:F-type H+-transporting ATPase subunit delta